MEKLKHLPLHRPKIKKRHRQPSVAQKAFFRCLVSTLAGFLLSNAKLIGEIRPFAVAVPAAVPSEYEVWSAFGASLGVLLCCDLLDALKYISAIVMLTLLRVVAHSVFEKENTVVVHTLAAGVGLCVCAVAVELAKGVSTAGLILCACEGMLGGAGTFLLRRLLVVMQKKDFVTQYLKYW